MNSTHLQEPKILRRLGFMESLCDEELINNNLSITTACIITIPNEFKITEELFKKAIDIWANIHPFLLSKIIRDLDKNHKSRIDMAKDY